MNSKDAKKLSLPNLMSQLGYEPVKSKKGGYQLWYNSPFRTETKPSLVTSFLGGKWIWNDFGDIGGTIIDFVMRHEGFHSVADALAYLDKAFYSGKPITTNALFFKQQAAQPKFERELKFVSATRIKNPQVISYLTEERCLNKEVVLSFLQKINYQNLNNSKFFMVLEYVTFPVDKKYVQLLMISRSRLL